MDEVFLVWKDYGGGDCELHSVHSTAHGACEEVRVMFSEAKVEGKGPWWGDGKLDGEDHYGFKADDFEVEVSKRPLKS